MQTNHTGNGNSTLRIKKREQNKVLISKLFILPLKSTIVRTNLIAKATNAHRSAKESRVLEKIIFNKTCF